LLAAIDITRGNYTKTLAQLQQLFAFPAAFEVEASLRAPTVVPYHGQKLHNYR
jgi:hypothetical protein